MSEHRGNAVAPSLSSSNRSSSIAGSGWPTIDLWASTLFDELVEMGFTGSYPSLTLAIRTLALRPHCEPCQSVKGRDVAVIDHPPAVETQWDCLELPEPPTSWATTRQAHLLVGALAHSSRWRSVLAPAGDFAHLVEALEGGQHSVGWGHPAVAVRPDGHGLPSGIGPDHRGVRRGGQTLWCRR